MSLKNHSPRADWHAAASMWICSPASGPTMQPPRSCPVSASCTTSMNPSVSWWARAFPEPPKVERATPGSNPAASAMSSVRPTAAISSAELMTIGTLW